MLEASSESERTSVSDSLLPSYLLTGEYFTTGSSDYKCFLFVFFSLKIVLVFTPLTSVCNDIPSKQ